MEKNETIVIRVNKYKNKEDTYSLQRCLNGKTKESYRSVSKGMIVSDVVNILNDFQPQRSRLDLEKLSD